MKRKALITGITGQDGSYLAEFLLEKDYDVYGLVRRVALEDPLHRLRRLQHISDRIDFISGSVDSFASVFRVLKQVQPDEVYHLAAQSYVGVSFEDEFSTFDVNINGTHYLLSACRELVPHTRFYFAASSEMFGIVDHSPQNETTRFHPRSAYGISKTAGFHLTRNYRESSDLFACSGILFNHESPRRGFEFVTRKITSHAARIKKGLLNELALGNLDAQRDWGYAPDYVRAMWMMLQQDQPDDYVIATGKPHSVRQFCEKAFACLDLDYRDYVTRDPRFYRPAETHILLGDASKARQQLGWQPQHSFDHLVETMVRHDLQRLQQPDSP